MLQRVTAGPGDVATWGPITGRQDPRRRDFTGELTTEMTIGSGCARVVVTSTYFEGDPEKTVVKFNGADVTKLLDDAQFDEIDRHFVKHWAQIVRENREEALPC